MGRLGAAACCSPSVAVQVLQPKETRSSSSLEKGAYMGGGEWGLQ